MPKQKSLSEKIEDLVGTAWSNGMRAGHHMTPSRQADELHHEIWTELQEVLTLLEEKENA